MPALALLNLTTTAVSVGHGFLTLSPWTLLQWRYLAFVTACLVRKSAGRSTCPSRSSCGKWPKSANTLVIPFPFRDPRVNVGRHHPRT